MGCSRGRQAGGGRVCSEGGGEGGAKGGGGGTAQVIAWVRVGCVRVQVCGVMPKETRSGGGGETDVYALVRVFEV